MSAARRLRRSRPSRRRAGRAVAVLRLVLTGGRQDVIAVEAAGRAATGVMAFGVPVRAVGDVLAGVTISLVGAPADLDRIGAEVRRAAAERFVIVEPLRNPAERFRAQRIATRFVHGGRPS